MWLFISGLVIGAIPSALGILAGRALTIGVQTSLKLIALNFWVIQIVSVIPVFKHATVSGPWSIDWKVRSTNFPSNNPAPVQVRYLLGRVVARGNYRDTNGRMHSYGFLGHHSGPYITGTWFDLADRTLGYHGTFQVRIEPTLGEATGRWLGFSHTGPVKGGAMRWEKAHT